MARGSSVQRWIRAACVASSLGGLAAPALADRAVLSGGTVVEGKVTRVGERVVIEIESGTITLPASAVVKIEKSESPVDRVATRHAALAPRDIGGRLSLADFCRDHGMRAKERELLAEILEIDPEHAAARTRLGYVKTKAGWISEAEAMRERGMVPYEGRFVPAAEAKALVRAERETDLAETRRAERDDLDAEQRRLARERADLESERVQLEARRTTTLSPVFSYFTPFYRAGFPLADADCPYGRGCPRRMVRPAMPADTSLSVVKVPYSH